MTTFTRITNYQQFREIVEHNNDPKNIADAYEVEYTFSGADNIDMPAHNQPRSGGWVDVTHFELNELYNDESYFQHLMQGQVRYRKMT